MAAPKMNITFFYHKLDTKYLFIQKFFRKKCFPRKALKTVLRAHLTILGKERI